MTFLNLLFVIGVFVASVALTVLLVRAAARRFLLWRKYRRLPIVVASDDDLTKLPVYWPRRPGRWPSPAGPEGRALSAEQLRAFSRAALARRHLNRFSAEALLLVGGAALGVQIPGALKTLGSYLEQNQKGAAVIYQGDMSAVWSYQLGTWGGALVTVAAGFAIFVIPLAYVLRENERDYEYLGKAYADFAAKRESDALVDQPETGGRRREWWRVFSSRSSVS